MALLCDCGARLTGARPEIVAVMLVAVGVYDRHARDCVVTSVTEGKHRKGSLHYVGSAVDLRTRHLPGGASGSDAQAVGDQLRAALGPDFDVIVEKNHVHIEHQPKTGLNFQA